MENTDLEYTGRVLSVHESAKIVVLGDDDESPDKIVTIFWELETIPEAHSWITASLDPFSKGGFHEVLKWAVADETKNPVAGYTGNIPPAFDVEHIKSKKDFPVYQWNNYVPSGDCHTKTEYRDDNLPKIDFADWLAITKLFLNSLVSR